MRNQTRPTLPPKKRAGLRSAFDEERYAGLVERLRDIRETVAAHWTPAPRSPDDVGAKYAEIFDLVALPCLVLDANGMILASNATGAAFLGLDRARIVHSSLLMYMAADGRWSWLDHMHRLRTRKHDVVTEVRLRTPDGDVPVAISSRAVRLQPEAHPMYLAVVLDLRASRRLASEQAELTRLREAEAARDRARAASAAKDRFLALLSHELRTPLTPVLLATAALKDDATLPAPVRATLAMVHRNVVLEARLVDDLLDLSRITQSKLALASRSVDLHAVVGDVLRLLQAEIEAAGVTIALDLHATRPVQGDPVRLDQVVWNLVRNALHASTAGGRIAIAARDRGPATVELVVSDTGAGFDPADAARLFEPFTQLGGEDAKHRGLGLGLAIVAGLVRAHSGTVAAWSDGPGRGACFTVELPASSAEPAADRARPITGPAPTAEAPFRVLLVEDHADTATALALVLEQEGYTVDVATSIAEARAAAERARPDLLVSDLGLPDGSGLDLVRLIGAERPVRGVALTGWGRPDDVTASRAAGFERHLTKPVDLPDLLATIASFRSSGN